MGAYKKFIIKLVFILMLAVSLKLQAQTPINSPSLVQDEIIEVSGITSDAQINALTPGQKMTSHVFFDGLGRQIQTIALNASPAQNDIINFSSYNNLDQKIFEYLPYIKPANAGAFDHSSTTDQSSYYSNGLSDKVTDDASPWSQISVESSPLQRVINAGRKGSGFQTTSGQHYKSINYRSYNPNSYTNDGYNTGVRLWLYNGTSSATYLAGSLVVTELQDESGNVTAFYEDANHRLVLKRQILSPSMTIDNTVENCLDTYYIYDDSGELLYIIPPKALTSIRNLNSNPWNVAASVASTLIFSFVYDNMGRVIEKKAPSSDWIYIIYDPMNRPVLTQDGNLRAANKWMYYKYDRKQRIISKGIYTDAANIGLTAMQSYVSGLSGTVYATYYYEEKQTGGTAPNFYTNRIFPTSNIQDLIYNYFDDYDFNNDGTPDYAYQVQTVPGEEIPTALTRSFPTGSFKKTLNNDGTLSVWLHSVYFYDKRSHQIQVLSNNHTNVSAADTKTFVNDFIGKVDLVQIKKNVNSATTTVLTNYGYDTYNRLISVDQTNNGGSLVHVAVYQYNEIGQLVTRRLYSTDDVNFLQNVDYRYNINGELTSINNATLTVDNVNYTNADANDVFGEEILYEKNDQSGLGNSNYFNGNISAVKWKDLPPSGNNSERSFKYSYDQLNRLTSSHYAEWNIANSNWAQSVGYNDENVSAYDANGNIENLQRYSLNTQIDNLTYSYSSNQLSNVADATNNISGFNGTIAPSSTYLYDANGNLVSDPKKSATYTYNVLNRADRLNFSNGNYIRYSYDAGGTLVRKEVYTSASQTTTTFDYIDGFVFQNNSLSYFPMAEGRIRNNSGILTFEYFIRDHLGNVRISFDGGTTIAVREENSFYPFGMTLPGNYIPTLPNTHLFNGGNEWQNDFANIPDLYQTHFRNYDPELGRFIAVDPISISSESLSPYQFVENNPISSIDPRGDIVPSPILPYSPINLNPTSVGDNVPCPICAVGGLPGTVGAPIAGSGANAGSNDGAGDEGGSDDGGGSSNVYLDLGAGDMYGWSTLSWVNSVAMNFSNGTNSGRQPISTDYLRILGVKGALNKGPNGIRFNYVVGKMFEEAVLRLFKPYGVKDGFEISSPARKIRSRNKRRSVIPDGIGLAVNTEGGVGAFFLEVKAVNGTLTLSQNYYQIYGEIEAAAANKVGNVTPQLAFVTTGNTFIGNDILKEAQDDGVLIVQYYAFTDPDDEGSIFIGAPTQKNMLDRTFIGLPILGSDHLIGPPKPDTRPYDQEYLDENPE